jgi:hypothetical protein
MEDRVCCVRFELGAFSMIRSSVHEQFTSKGLVWTKEISFYSFCVLVVGIDIVILMDQVWCMLMIPFDYLFERVAVGAVVKGESFATGF